MLGTRGTPGTQHDIGGGEGYLFGYLALEGPGDRRAKRAPRCVALTLGQFTDHAPEPGLGLGAPAAIDV